MKRLTISPGTEIMAMVTTALQISATRRLRRKAYAREQGAADRDVRRENARMRSAERPEKARLKAVTDIARAYYKRSQPHYHIW